MLDTADSAVDTAMLTVAVAVSTVDMAEANAVFRVVEAVDVSGAGETTTCSEVGSSSADASCIPNK